MEATPTTGDKALKIRSLLQSYYDDNDQQTDQVEGSAARRTSNDTFAATPSPAPSLPQGGEPHFSDAPINAIYFDPDAHLRRMVRETRLASLVDEHRSMVAEVGALDSDMQTLVYENYNKFIVATDIIRSLDGAMSCLDDRLHYLDSKIGDVVDRSETVNGTLEQRQAAIMEMNMARLLLQKLQLVLDVPRKLRAALDSDAYDVAAETYAQAAPVLKKHGHRTALQDVAHRVEACRIEAADKLRSRLLSQPETASETIALIAQLGEPTESLQDDFLGCQRQRLSAILEAARGPMAAAAGTITTATEEGGLKEAVVRFSNEFLSELERTAVLFVDLFDKSCRPRLVSEAREWFLRYSATVRSALETAAAVRVAAASRLEVSGARLSGTTDDALEGPPGREREFLRDWGVAALAAVLCSIRDDVPRLEAAYPELTLRDKTSELAGNVVRQHVTLAFAAVEARVAVEVRELAAKASSGAGAGAGGDTRSGMEGLQFVAISGLERAFAGVGEWGSQTWILEGWAEVFSTLVQSQVVNWLQSVPQRCLACAGLVVAPPAPAISGSEGTAPFYKAWELGSAGVSSTHNTASPQLLLTLSIFCSYLGTKLARRAAQLLAGRSSGPGDAPGISDGDSAYGSSALEAAKTLLKAYIARISEDVAYTAQSAVDGTSWGNHPEAKAPSTLCSQLLDRMAQVESDLEAAERAAAAAASGAGGSIGAEAGLGAHHRRQSTGGGSTESGSAANLGGVGPSTTAILPVAWKSRSEIVCGMASVGLQAQAAALRKHTLSRAGFQQVQLDCHFLRPQLQRAADGAPGGQSALIALEEVLVVAAERCGEPVMLEPAVLDRMVAVTQLQRRT